MMICTLSGQTTSDPVVSPRSGAIFDRLLISKYLKASGTDPVTDEPLFEEELIPIRPTTEDSITPVKNTSTNSIPSLLSTFQDEWDALSIEVFSLRKQLHNTRQELSASLYQYDAAVRVSTRLLQERDEARAALQELSSAIGNRNLDTIEKHVKESVETPTTTNDNDNKYNNDGNDDESMSNGYHELSETFKSKIMDTQASLFATHKSTKIPAPLKEGISIAPIDNENELNFPFKKVSSAYFDATEKSLYVSSPTGVLASLDFINEEKILYRSKQHKPITSISIYKGEPIVVQQKGHTNLITGSGEVVDFAVTSLGEIVLIASHPGIPEIVALFLASGEWTLYTVADPSSPSLIFRPGKQSVEGQFTCGDFHVDGALIAAGSDNGQVYIFETITGKIASSIAVANKNVLKLTFALNGYWLFVLSGEKNATLQTLEVVDLRKSKVIHTIQGKIQDFVVDNSSTVVVNISGNSLSVNRYHKKTKSWDESPTTFEVASPILKMFSVNTEEGLKLIVVTDDAKAREYLLN